MTDGSGKAVPGLTVDDFEVFDGGHRVPIVAFQSVDPKAPSVSGPASVLPMAIQAAAPRQFLLLLDLQFSLPDSIKRARTAAARFVRESLGPNDLVAVARFGRDGLKMLTNFTMDREYVTRAIETLGFLPARSQAGRAPVGRFRPESMGPAWKAWQPQ